MRRALTGPSTTLRVIGGLMILLAGLFVAPRSSQAALPPEAYEQLRVLAPIAFVGTVQHDTGGRAMLRVDQVLRGFIGVGRLVTVVYPLEQGAPVFPGPEVYYRRFVPGMRLRVFGQPGLDAQSVQIAHGGIDVLYVPPPPRTKAGCAACAIETGDGGGTHAWPLGLLGLVLVARRRRRAEARVRGSALVIGASFIACSPTGPSTVPGPATSQPVDDGEEVAIEGNSTVVVESRPNDPNGTPMGQPAGPRTIEMCRADPACASAGHCTPKGTTCAAVSMDDCLQMPACDNRRCNFIEGACVVLKTCAGTFLCEEEGVCDSLMNGCIAASDESCQGSRRCRNEGVCSSDGMQCVVKSDADCKDAAVCASDGRCKAVDGRCVVESDAQCKARPACTQEGRCLARDGVCVKSCSESDACRAQGQCGERPDRPGLCVATTDAQCDQSEVCKAAGHCSMGLNGVCEAGDDVECRLSRMCNEHGRCSHQRGKCVVGSDAECAASTVACKRDGRCTKKGAGCAK